MKSRPIEIMGSMTEKKRLPDMDNKSAADGFTSTPMYDEAAYTTPANRPTVRIRGMRKEMEDGR